ncbi:hypothetical protein DSL72_005192 [Monilinia vaccinii-corymbosi]|uniref:CCHC-type domain-containing protein n=1 Tax=Monilinia vaccinii-corymbosi TaxID=61207 RepID=A0A8A3PEZ6_9HELO|nr:hypothetical protein DSL72_005192 [Monilinia vaccinii-corymbosi]
MFSREESRQNDPWENFALLELLYRSPDLVTEDDLRGISLSNLAKNVNDELPSPLKMKTYIRWLEAHRKGPSQLLKAWPNTIKQWVESLKHRGFDKEEVILDVENWKKANGLFSKRSGKYLPSVDEIKRAFDEKHTMRKERSSGTVNSKRGRFRTERSSSKTGSGSGSSDHVPMSYICNRCGKNGHLVKSCPTNMDPTFDKRPPKSYKCCICNEFGKHWFGLCPKNKDTDSITQRRLAAGIEAPAQHRGIDRRDTHKPKLDGTSMLNEKYKIRERESKHQHREKWEAFGTLDSVKHEQTKTLNYDDSEEPELSAPTTKLELLADIEERMHQVSAAMARDTGMSIEGVAGMTGVTISNMAATIMAANCKRARSVELDDVGYTENQRIIRKKLDYDSKDEQMHEFGGTDFVHSGDGQPDVGGILKKTDPYTEFELRENLAFTRLVDPAEHPLQFRQSNLAMRPRKMSSMNTSSEGDVRTPVDDMEEGFDSPRVRSETPEKIYSDFVRSLIENRTEGLQVVNQRRSRNTALQMWNEDDQRRMTGLNISRPTPQNSPTLSFTSMLASDFEDDVTEVDHPIDDSLDRAESEILHFSCEHNTPVSPTSDIAMQETGIGGPG